MRRVEYRRSPCGDAFFLIWFCSAMDHAKRAAEERIDQEMSAEKCRCKSWRSDRFRLLRLANFEPFLPASNTMLPLAACRTAHHRAFLSRALVTAATFSSGPTSSSSLRSLLQQHLTGEAASPPPTATLFALSQNTPDLASIIHLLKDRYPLVVGCLSSSTGDDDDDHHSLAIAHFFDDERSSYRVFRAATEGRGKVSVGHWRPPGEMEHPGGAGGRRERRQTLEAAMSSGDWSGLWAGNGGADRSSVGSSALQGLEDVE